jgi:RNA polymerase sigma-70 factor (ECF subfamily)
VSDVLKRPLTSHDLAAAFDSDAAAIYSHCLRRVGEATLAEDLLSVVFLEAWRNRDSAVFIGGGLRPWLLVIALNVCRNSARSNRRHAAALNRYRSMHAGDATPDAADEATRASDLSAQVAAVNQALRSLPRLQRSVAELCLLNGISVAAAASALGIPEGTAKSRLARARTSLRRLLRSSELCDPEVSGGHHPNERPSGVSAGAQSTWSPA